MNYLDDTKDRAEQLWQERQDGQVLDSSKNIDPSSQQILDIDLQGINDPAVAEDMMKQLRSVMSKLPPNSLAHSQLQTSLEEIRKKIEEIKREQEEEDTQKSIETTGAIMAATGAATSTAFTSALFNHMNQAERDFFNSFVPGQKYQTAALDQNGNLVYTAQTIDGAELQQDFSVIKYHSLSREEKEALREGKIVSDLGELRGALDRMESYKLGACDPKDAKGCHDQFALAHEQIESVERLRQASTTLDAAAKANPLLAMNATITGIALKFNEDKLSEVLEKNVIQDTLLEKDEPGKTAAVRITGGMDVEEPSRPPDTGARPSIQVDVAQKR